MPPITHEVTPAGGKPGENGAGGTGTSGAQPSRRMDAVGLEIAVVVHASRYSAAARGAGKNLPSVHEETRTVIVFPQGAVVRLSASMSPGELVVLTNQQTGSDVLCRVANVKAQPGIQNYVELEFTQRAPGFWEDRLAANFPVRTEAPSAATVPTAVAVPPSEPVRQEQPAARVQEPVLAMPPAKPVVVPQPAVTQTPVTIPLPIADVQPVRPVQVPSTIGLGGAREAELTQPRTATPEMGSFGKWAPATESRSGSKKGFLIAAAAVAFTVLSAGGVMLYRQERSTSKVQQTSASVPSQGGDAAQTGMSVGGQSGAGLVSVSVEPAVMSSVAVPASQGPGSSAAPAAKPANVVSTNTPSGAQSPRRAGVAMGQLSRPNFKGPSESSSIEPPPVLSAEISPIVAGNGLVAGAGRDLAAPPPAVAPTAAAGRLDPPKLISSPSAIYPALARAQNVEGIVVVDALVDVNGKVAQAQVVSGSVLLREAALDAVRSWKYQPGRLNGQAAPVHTQVSLDFRLTGPSGNAGAATAARPASSEGSSVAAPAAPTAAVPSATASSGFEGPKLLSSPPPAYPAIARAGNIEGTVVVDALVGIEGKIIQMRIISGPQSLQRAAMDALRTWKYEPARLNGQTIEQHTQVSVNFRLH